MTVGVTTRRRCRQTSSARCATCSPASHRLGRRSPTGPRRATVGHGTRARTRTRGVNGTARSSWPTGWAVGREGRPRRPPPSPPRSTSFGTAATLHPLDWSGRMASVNDAVMLAGRRAGHDRVGAAIAVVRCIPGRVVISHAGDVRIYRLRGGEVQLLTRDHTVGTEINSAGRDPRHASRRDRQDSSAHVVPRRDRRRGSAIRSGCSTPATATGW